MRFVSILKIGGAEMDKKQAIAYFGGVRATARAVGITSVAVSRWPDVLSPRIADRIIAALARRGLTVADFKEAENVCKRAS